MRASTIEQHDPVVRGNRVILTASMTYGSGSQADVTFEFTAPADGDHHLSARPALLAFLIPAMRVGDPVVLRQWVDPVTVMNLAEWQEAMSTWSPDRLRPVPIIVEADPLPVPVPRFAGGLTTFSGGVDSSFTLMRNTVGSAEPVAYRRAPLAAGLMIHGFDIALEDEAVFESAFLRSRRILEGFGLEAYRLRTDVRQFEVDFGCDWPSETHGIWLAAGLACLEPHFTHTVLPSTYPYHQQQLPWASNPMTDPLLGSWSRPLWHDGAALHKLAKVDAVAHHPLVQQYLRVCWEGGELDRNCGHCWKCRTTQACFWLNDVPAPACFHDPCTVGELAEIAVDGYRGLLVEQMRARADATGQHDLAAALARALGVVGAVDS